jgi:hypothetical protein
MLWLMLAIALLLVGMASFGPAGGLRKRTRERRKKAA